jgi:hypothetical protein
MEWKKEIYIHLVLALLRPVGNALLARLTPECGQFAKGSTVSVKGWTL